MSTLFARFMYVGITLFLPNVYGIDGLAWRRAANSTKCKIEDYPFMVLLPSGMHPVYAEDDAEHYISGILLNMEWVVTAHTPLQEKLDKNPGKEFKTYAGTSSPVDKGQSRVIEKTVEIPVPNPPIYTDRIFLTKLKTPFEESKSIHGVPLPPSHDFIYSCDEVTAVGWGMSNDRKRNDPDLKCTQLNLVSCNVEMENTYFCADSKSPDRSMCKGDGGQAIMCKGVIIGILLEPFFCMWYQLNALNIAHYMTWLRENSGVSVPFESTPDHSHTPWPIKPYDKARSTPKGGSDDLDWNWNHGNGKLSPDASTDLLRGLRTTDSNRDEKGKDEREQSTEADTNITNGSLKVKFGTTIGILVFIVWVILDM